jgi:PKD repeat protein
VVKNEAMKPPRLFISYSHKDEAWKDRIVTQLGVLAQKPKLELWDDRKIAAGEDWFSEIGEAIQDCDLALLLVSADFLTSNFILKKEVPKLLQRRAKDGIHVIPVILRPCAWRHIPWLAGIQARPKDGKPLTSLSKNRAEEALAALAVEILQLSMDGRGVRPNDKAKDHKTECLKERQRRIDAVVPSTAESSENVDLFIQVRFAASPPLSIKDWPLEKLPSELRSASETVNLVFPKNSSTGKLESARLCVVVVTSDFEVQNGPERLLDVPPLDFSKLISFLLKPKRLGECRINLEVYDLNKILLGTVPLETTVGAGIGASRLRIAHLDLTVDVKQQSELALRARRRKRTQLASVAPLLLLSLTLLFAGYRSYLPQPRERRQGTGIQNTLSTNTPIKPEFSIASSEPRIGTPVRFQNLTAGSVTDYRWSLGDGTTSTARNPVHQYARPGAYQVSLTARSFMGDNSVPVFATVSKELRVTENVGDAIREHSVREVIKEHSSTRVRLILLGVVGLLCGFLGWMRAHKLRLRGTVEVRDQTTGNSGLILVRQRLLQRRLTIPLDTIHREIEGTISFEPYRRHGVIYVHIVAFRSNPSGGSRVAKGTCRLERSRSFRLTIGQFKVRYTPKSGSSTSKDGKP